MKNLVQRPALILVMAGLYACGGMGANPDTSNTPRDRGPAGYADQPSDQMAGAVSSLEPNDENDTTYNTMVEMLRGRVPGLQISESPSGEISMRIRGIQSINAQTDPLLVVDGMPVPAYSFSSTLRTMDPRDVRTIQVLKDAGSTSMYGSRGAHGVILIKMKRR